MHCLMSKSGRPGFSLVELLVVIAIIGVLIALLLPAVQSARESARRLACRNNLKQLGLAVLNYESSMRRLPASGLVKHDAAVYVPFDPKPGSGREGSMLSWIVEILPQLDESPLYDQFDFSRTAIDQPKNPQAQPIASIVCPSDSAQGSNYVDADLTGGRRFAKGNYAAFTSPYHIDLQNWYPGALVANRRQRINAITDGTSHTFCLGEIRTRSNPADQRGAWALAWSGATLLAFDGHPLPNFGSDSLTVGEAAPGYVFGSVGGERPPNGANPDMLYECSDSAAAKAEGMPCEVGSGFYSAAPRSNHPGGVNVVFLDGHVDFIQDTIDLRAMAYLISINDGQVIGSYQSE